MKDATAIRTIPTLAVLNRQIRERHGACCDREHHIRAAAIYNRGF